MSDVYLQVKRFCNREPMSGVMGPMSERRAERVTLGLLANMADDCFVDEWSDGESLERNKAKP